MLPAIYRLEIVHFRTSAQVKEQTEKKAIVLFITLIQCYYMYKKNKKET